jgi:hypothetical protein
MLASIPELREVDFSHLTIADTNPESVASVRKQRSRLLWPALFLSLLLHLSLLLFQFGDRKFHVHATPKLHVELHQLNTKKPDLAPEIITARPVEIPSAATVEQESITAPVVAEKAVTLEKSVEAESAPRLVIEPLSAQELAEVVDSQRVQSNNRAAAGIAENVFHPGVRGRLIEEASKPVLARVEGAGPQTYTDPSGAMVVVLGNGQCLKSPMNTKIGAPQNWYMTSCGGKSESEKIMERVEQSINGKLKFDVND